MESIGGKESALGLRTGPCAVLGVDVVLHATPVGVVGPPRGVSVPPLIVEHAEEEMGVTLLRRSANL